MLHAIQILQMEFSMQSTNNFHLEIRVTANIECILDPATYQLQGTVHNTSYSTSQYCIICLLQLTRAKVQISFHCNTDLNI